MATFVLVHGAFHGAWCWSRLIPLLEARGHEVDAPDLLRPDDRAERDGTAWLDLWAGQIVDRVTAHREPVILVGHSRAGIVISEAAERAPDRIAGLVYIAAMLVHDGETMAAARTRLRVEETTPLRLRRSADGRMIEADPAAVADLIYHGSSQADRAFAAASITPEPRATFDIAPHVTAARFGRVARAYVECTNDRAISLSRQRGMQAPMPCNPVVTLATDHAPYFSAPERLAGALDEIARGFIRGREQAADVFNDSVDELKLGGQGLGNHQSRANGGARRER